MQLAKDYYYFFFKWWLGSNKFALLQLFLIFLQFKVWNLSVPSKKNINYPQGWILFLTHSTIKVPWAINQASCTISNLTECKMDPQNLKQSNCSNLLAFAYRTLGSYQPNLNWNKNFDGSENSYQSTYLLEIME